MSPNDPGEAYVSQQPWFTQEVDRPAAAALHELLSSSGGGGAARSRQAPAQQQRTGAVGLEVQRLAAALAGLRGECDVDVVDYCNSRARFTTGLTDATLASFLAEPRPEWSKVRWVCVTGGISGDVMRALAERFDLQPLAIDDALSFNRVKLDAYPEHLFVTTYTYDLEGHHHHHHTGAGAADRHTSATAAARAIVGLPPPPSPRAGSDVEGGGARSVGGASVTAAASSSGSESSDDGYSADADACLSPWRVPMPTEVSSSRAAARPRTRGWFGGGTGAKRGGSASTDGPPGADGQRRLEKWLLQQQHARGALMRAARHGSATLARVSAVAMHHQPPSPGGFRGPVPSAASVIAATAVAAPSPPWRQLRASNSLPSSLPAAAASATAASAATAAAFAEPPTPPSPLPAAPDGPPPAWQTAHTLGTKCRRKARLRMPLQAPFFALSRQYAGPDHPVILIEQASFFLCRGGVVISLFQQSGAAVAAPVLARLRGMHSLLVESEDAGVLLQALLQSALDYSAPVIEALAVRVAKIDAQVMAGRTHVRQSQQLHALATDLATMQRSFATIHHMLAALHARAQAGPYAVACSSGGEGGGNGGNGNGGGGGGVHLTELAGQYLRDTMDHAETGEQDLAALAEHTRRLSDMVFNSVSHRNEAANITMAVVGLLFLPLSFLTGVFGMNFAADEMPVLAWSYGMDAFAAMCVFVCVFCLGFVYVTRILPPPSWAVRLCHGAADAATGLLRRVQQQHQQRRRWQWKRAKAGTTGSARRGGGAVEIVGPQLV